MNKFISYRGSLRTDYLKDMYNALLDCAKYNRKYYEDFMNARVLDVGSENGKLVFKVEMRSNPEIYATVMRQLSKRVRDARVMMLEPRGDMINA